MDIAFTLASGPIARSAAIVLTLRCLNIVLGFITTIILARSLGAEEFGVFALGASVALLVSLPARLGLQPFLVKFLPGLELQPGRAGFVCACKLAAKLGLAASLVAAFSVAILLWLSGQPGPLRNAGILGALTSPLIAMVSICQSYLRARFRPFQAFAPEFLFMQVAFASVAAALLLTNMLTARSALLAFGGSWLVALIVGMRWVLLDFNKIERATTTFQPPWKSWILAIAAMTIAGLFTLAVGRIEPIALAAFGSATDIGNYAIALRFALLVTFPAFAISSGLGPALARLDAVGDRNAVGDRLQRSAQAGLAGVIAATIVVIGLTFWIVPLFGADYSSARPAMLILLAGFVVQSLAGRASDALTMLGHLREAVLAGVISTGVYIGLSFLLVRDFGLVGAAAATAIAVTIHSALLATLAWRKIRIRCDVFASAFSKAS